MNTVVAAAPAAPPDLPPGTGAPLRLHGEALAEAAVALAFGRRPELLARYGALARARALQDAIQQLSSLAESLEHDSPALFLDHIGWARIVLSQRGVQTGDQLHHLDCLAEVLAGGLPPALAAPAVAAVRQAMQQLPAMPTDRDSHLDPADPLSPLAHAYLQALLRGDRASASRMVLQAVGGGTPIKQVYLQIFQPVQYEIGRLWQLNRLSVAQEHYCTAATQLVMSQLYTHLFDSPRNGRSMVATCVSGDLHEIGARMVSDFFEMAGWDTYYLGASTPAAGVVQTLVERDAQLLAVSATIGYQVHPAQLLIATVRAHPACAGVVILVGGQPFRLDPGLWRRIGADGTAIDAQSAITLGAQLVDEREAAAR